MAEYGVTPSGFVLKRLDDIYSEVTTALKEQIGVDPSENPQGILNVMTTIFCDQLASLWEEYSNGYENLFPLTADGIALDRCMEIGGVSRIGKSRTTYMLACTGKEGTVIPAGALVQTSTSPTRQFQCASISEISSKNWKVLEIRPIENISGKFSFSFEIERNATSGDVGATLESSTLAKDLEATSYGDAVDKIYTALKDFTSLEQYGISVSKKAGGSGDESIVLSGSKASDSFSSSLCPYVSMRHSLSDWRVALLLHRNYVARPFPLDYGCRWWHLLCRHWRTEQLHPVGNAAVETGWDRSSLCDGHGASCRHPAESDAWFAHLGLLRPAL